MAVLTAATGRRMERAGSVLGRRGWRLLRETTERIDVVQAGTAKFVRTNPATNVAEANRLPDDHPLAYAAMARVANPSGDSRAAQRVIAAVAGLLSMSPLEGRFAAV